jgi:hypothetical protein
MDPDSGKIALHGEAIHYFSEFYGNWELSLSDVIVIGEATNQNGPADDYFFCFASGPWMWHEASFYAQGRNEFLNALSRRLGVEMRLGLISSTDFASRVLWPPELAGKPMFKYVEVCATSRVSRRIFGDPDRNQMYSDVVADLLRSDKRARRRWD